MYILHAIPDGRISDGGTAMLHLIERRDPKQFRMKVLLPEDSLLRPLLEARGISTLPLPLRTDRPFSLRDLPRLMRSIRRERPDILHTHGYTGARLAGAISGVRTLISTRHGTIPHTRMHRLFRFLYRGFTTFTVTTTDQARNELTKRGVRPDLTAVISDGVPPLPRLTSAERRQARCRLGIPEDAFVIGLLAPLTPEGRVETLLLAARELQCRGASFRVLCLGGGERREVLRRLSDKLGLSAHILFPERGDDPISLCNLLDVAVGTGASVSLSFVGAMSLSIPVLLPDTERSTAFVRDGVSGILFPPQDYTALAAELDSLRLRQWDRFLLSIGAERCYRTQFTDTEMYRAYELLYLSLHRS